jgi:hypothetical protein
MLGGAKADEEMPVLQKGLKEEAVIDGQGLSEFVEEADVPDFIEGLGDVKDLSVCPSEYQLSINNGVTFNQQWFTHV